MRPPLPPPSTLFPYTTLFRSQTSCGAEVLRGAVALAREHSGKGTTSVLEPALSEAEGAEQLPFLIVIPSGFSREESAVDDPARRSEEHTSELQSRFDLVCRLL